MKRLFDFAAALSLMVVLMPFLLGLIIFIRLLLGSPVFFKQIRPGLHARPFTMLKFRTMTERRDLQGNLLPDAERLTRFGRLLRSTSLDELPELINVVRGEMSLVGPRPLLMEYLPLYSKCQAQRHDVCPGVTGWAQVNGRNTLSWEQKFEFDVWYVKNRSFFLDMKIIGMTVATVFLRKGINQEGAATMDRFTGNRDVKSAQ